MGSTATLSKNQVTIAYLRMAGTKFPDKSLVEALAEADALTAELSYSEGDLETPNPEAAGGGTDAETQPEPVEGFNLLQALYTENAAPVNISAFGEAMELQREPAEKLLKKIAAAGYATQVKRGRGIAFIPSGE